MSRPGHLVNDDTYGSSTSAVWVIDGASDVSPRRWTPDASDARWYATTVSRAIARRVDDRSLSLTRVLEDAIADTASAFRQFGVRGIPLDAAPSASICLARAHGPDIDYAVLGDCALLVSVACQLQVVRDPRVSELEHPMVAHLAALVRDGVRDHAALRAAALPQIAAMRARMNRADGYWVMSLDPAAAAHAIRGRIPGIGDTPLVLASDGFCRLFDLYEALASDEFYTRAAQHGWEALYWELRDIETRDPQAQRFPRVKLIDDATGLVARLAHLGEPAATEHASSPTGPSIAGR
jgi:hypothetical protein